MEELREQVSKIVYQAIRVNAWSDENCKKWADQILTLPAIKDALAFHQACLGAFRAGGPFEVTEENLKSSGRSWG